MQYGPWKFISDCASSKVGRFVFVAYLVYLVSMISYAWGHFPYMTYPFRFYGERELFELINAPQIAFIRSARLVVRWEASKFTDVIASFYIALPWWIYGYAFELLVKRIVGTSRHEDLPEELNSVFDDERAQRRLVPAVLSQNWCIGKTGTNDARRQPR